MSKKDFLIFCAAIIATSTLEVSAVPLTITEDRTIEANETLSNPDIIYISNGANVLNKGTINTGTLDNSGTLTTAGENLTVNNLVNSGNLNLSGVI